MEGIPVRRTVVSVRARIGAKGAARVAACVDDATIELNEDLAARRQGREDT